MSDAKQPQKLTMTPFSSFLGCGIWDGEKHIAMVPNQFGQKETERLAAIVLKTLTADREERQKLL